VVISALANTYIDYVTTPEEYNVQRYEGASTIYGPYTLPAFIQEFNKLAVALAQVCGYIHLCACAHRAHMRACMCCMCLHVCIIIYTHV